MQHMHFVPDYLGLVLGFGLVHVLGFNVSAQHVSVTHTAARHQVRSSMCAPFL
jgi:hypothetical protein